jgi:hypothetical protein
MKEFADASPEDREKMLKALRLILNEGRRHNDETKNCTKKT